MIPVTDEHSPSQRATIAGFNRWLEQNNLREWVSEDVDIETLERVVFDAYLDGFGGGVRETKKLIFE